MGIAPRNIHESVGLMPKAMISEKISISGQRTATLISIWYAFCRFVTSVVSLVTILDVENLSMLENEKFCTL